MKYLIENKKTKIAQTTLLATLLATVALSPARAWAGSAEIDDGSTEFRNSAIIGAAAVGVPIAVYRDSKRVNKMDELRKYNRQIEDDAKRLEDQMAKAPKAGGKAADQVGVHFQTADYQVTELTGTPKHIATEFTGQMAEKKILHFFIYPLPVPAFNEEPTHQSLKTAHDTHLRASKNLKSRLSDAAKAQKMEHKFWGYVAAIGAAAYAGPIVFEKAKAFINDSTSVKRSAMQVSSGSAPESAPDSSQAASAK